jgi:steroid delta-isomerase-like uncharacterized protein
MTIDADLRTHREDLVRRHMANENTQAFDKVLSDFPHPRYEIIPTGAVYDGHEAVSRYYTESRTTFPDQSNEIIALRHADDAVIVDFWLRGTFLGPYQGLPPTGKRFECRMVAFFLFEGRELRCERVFFDALTIFKQTTGE